MSATAPRILLINLTRDAARREAMLAQLSHLGLAAEVWPAVDGRAMPPAAVAALYDAQANRRAYRADLTPGEIGCYASHLGIWQAVATGDAPWALVLEDDVTLLPTLPALLAQVRQWPAGWDMVKLQGWGRETVAQRWPLGPGLPDVIRYGRVPATTGAYVVSRAGARKLAAARVRFARPVDVDLRHPWECDLALYGLRPYVVTLAQSAAQSSIGQRQHRGGWRARWRKWRYQLGFTWAQWRHRIRAA